MATRNYYMDNTDNMKNNKTTFISRGIADTERLASIVAGKLKGGDVILLNGEMGAGKTAFTKCLAKRIGVRDIVTSPTFTFMKEYKGDRFALYHFDMFRAEDEDELYELGLNDYLYMNGICVIEWNKFEDVKDPIVIDIAVQDDGCRVFEISGIDINV